MDLVRFCIDQVEFFSDLLIFSLDETGNSVWMAQWWKLNGKK